MRAHHYRYARFKLLDTSRQAADVPTGVLLPEVLPGGYQRVALQFPDSMLPEAPDVFRELQSMLKASHLTALM